MIEELLKGGKSEILSQLASQFSLNQSSAEQVADVSINTVKDGLLSEITSGNLDGITSLFNGSSNGAASSIKSSLTDSLVSNLLSKVGLKSDIAVKIGQFVIPFIIENISSSKPSSGFDASDITKMFGGSAGDMLKDKAADLLKGGLGNLFN